MTEEYRKSYGKRIVNNGLHVVETDTGPVLKDDKDRIISGGTGTVAWGGITGTLSDQGDLVTALNGRATTEALSTEAGIREDHDVALENSIKGEAQIREANDNELAATKLDATKATYQTTAPTAAATDGGIHIVYLTAEPTTKYAGYIYLIAE